MEMAGAIKADTCQVANDVEDEKKRLLSVWELVMKDMHGKLLHDDGDTLNFLQNCFPKDVYPSRNAVSSTCDFCKQKFDPRFETPCTMPHEFVAGPRRTQAWPSIYEWTCRRCKKTFETDCVDAKPTESCSCSNPSGCIEPTSHDKDTSTATLEKTNEKASTEKNANDSYPSTNKTIEEEETATCTDNTTGEEATTISIGTDENPCNDKKTKKKKKKKKKKKSANGSKKKLPYKRRLCMMQHRRKLERIPLEQNKKSNAAISTDEVKSSQPLTFTVHVC